MIRLRTVVLALLALAPAAHAASSLPTVRSGHRPGPDVLYEEAPRAPQLENTAPFRARPILVSGATAYRRGEFLYQDFLYDAHGAAAARDPADPFTTASYTFSPKAGTVTSPTDPVFANDAADLVELRVKPQPDATLFRITLNTLNDPTRTAATIALGDGPSAIWPHGAGLRSPAARFLTVHGGVADLRDAAGAALSPAPTATVDVERRQLTVSVPHVAWDPGTQTVRMAAGVGLWDPAAGAYLAPQATRSLTQPGGGGVAPAIVNLAFRGSEPIPDLASIPAGVTIADAAAGAAYLGTWWREKAQSDALAGGTPGTFAADVDFAKLAAGTRDDAGVPQTGPMDRILASARSYGTGIDYGAECGGLTAATSAYAPCTGPLLGQLQPYALYVPMQPVPPRGYGFTFLLHSLSANYNQYLGTRNQSQLGERGPGSLVATPQGRGPDGFYRDVAEADIFEVWADVARRYRLDPGWTAVSGYSMGGLGTFRLLSRWPDLFARGFSVVGAGDPDADLAGLRNTPVMLWNAAGDELVNLERSEGTVKTLTDLGLRFSSFLFPAADHLTLATNDAYGPGAAFLGTHRVDRNPPHVTYVVDPETDSERAGSRADHAYWLSGLRVTDGEPRGTIDAVSAAFGVGDAPVLPVTTEPGSLEGGSRGSLAYVDRTLAWGEIPPVPPADALTVASTGVRAATVDTRRARLTCGPRVTLTGLAQLRLACPPVKAVVCRRAVRLRVPRVAGAPPARVRTRARVRVLTAGRIAVTRRTREGFPVRAVVATERGRVVATQRVGPCRR